MNRDMHIIMNTVSLKKYTSVKQSKYDKITHFFSVTGVFICILVQYKGLIGFFGFKTGFLTIKIKFQN